LVECYSCHAEDKELLLNSSTGGAITDLLIFAMEDKLVDEVLSTRTSKTNPLQTEPFIAGTKADVPLQNQNIGQSH
jgi:coenzyme F420 hydrogenase subunit beta